TNWISPLFLCSAASTGIAAIFLIARLGGLAPHSALTRLERADVWSMGLECVVFGLFLASLGALLVPVLQTGHGKLLVGGALVVGLLVPLALSRSGRPGPLAAFCALVGGFILRSALLTTPPEMLAEASKLKTPVPTSLGTPGLVLVPGSSPENARPVGG